MGFGSIITSLIVVIIVISVFLPHEVLGAFVFVWTAILDRVSRRRGKATLEAHPIFVSASLDRVGAGIINEEENMYIPFDIRIDICQLSR